MYSVVLKDLLKPTQFLTYVRDHFMDRDGNGGLQAWLWCGSVRNPVRDNIVVKYSSNKAFFKERFE